VLVTACNSDSATGPTNEQPDLTTLLNETSTAGLVSASAPVPGRLQGMGTAPAFVPSACAYSDASKSFTCPTVTVNGLTFTRSFKLFDAAGNPQSQLDRNTSAIETISSVTGTITFSQGNGATGSLTVDRHEDMTLSGIRTATHVLNGVATSTTSGDVTLPSSGTLHTETTSSEKTENLLLPNHRLHERWPKSGVITTHFTTKDTGDDGRTFSSTLDVTMTFDGTSIVTITVKSAFGTSTCKLDMSGSGARGCLP
jgi:hypothetical protein